MFQEMSLFVKDVMVNLIEEIMLSCVLCKRMKESFKVEVN